MPSTIYGNMYGPPQSVPTPWKKLKEGSDKGCIIDAMGCFVLDVSRSWNTELTELIINAVNTYSCTICDNNHKCDECKNKESKLNVVP